MVDIVGFMRIRTKSRQWLPSSRLAKYCAIGALLCAGLEFYKDVYGTAVETQLEVFDETSEKLRDDIDRQHDYIVRSVDAAAAGLDAVRELQENRSDINYFRIIPPDRPGESPKMAWDYYSKADVTAQLRAAIRTLDGIQKEMMSEDRSRLGSLPSFLWKYLCKFPLNSLFILGVGVLIYAKEMRETQREEERKTQAREGEGVESPASQSLPGIP